MSVIYKVHDNQIADRAKRTAAPHLQPPPGQFVHLKVQDAVNELCMYRINTRQVDVLKHVNVH